MALLTRIGVGGVVQTYGTITAKTEDTAVTPRPGTLFTRIGVGGVVQTYGAITDKTEDTAVTPRPGTLFTRIGVGGVGVYYPVTDKVEAVIPPDIPEEIEPGRGGKAQFEVFPRRIWLKTKLDEPALRLKDIEPTRAKEILEKPTPVTIDGEVYLVSEGVQPTPKEALKMLPPTELLEKLELVQKEFAVTKVKARVILEKIAAKEMLISEQVKLQLVREDDELALIIIMSEV